MYERLHAPALPLARLHARARTCTRVHARAHARTHACTHEHMCMHARTCTHMHARTCTHAQVFRHLYSAGSVYCYHLYINGEDQPGLGWNYQTAAVVCMVGGRLLANNNMLTSEAFC